MKVSILNFAVKKLTDEDKIILTPEDIGKPKDFLKPQVKPVEKILDNSIVVVKEIKSLVELIKPEITEVIHLIKDRVKGNRNQTVQYFLVISLVILLIVFHFFEMQDFKDVIESIKLENDLLREKLDILQQKTEEISKQIQTESKQIQTESKQIQTEPKESPRKSKFLQFDLRSKVDHFFKSNLLKTAYESDPTRFKIIIASNLILLSIIMAIHLK